MFVLTVSVSISCDFASDAEFEKLEESERIKYSVITYPGSYQTQYVNPIYAAVEVTSDADCIAAGFPERTLGSVFGAGGKALLALLSTQGLAVVDGALQKTASQRLDPSDRTVLVKQGAVEPRLGVALQFFGKNTKLRVKTDEDGTKTPAGIGSAVRRTSGCLATRA